MPQSVDGETSGAEGRPAGTLAPLTPYQGFPGRDGRGGGGREAGRGRRRTTQARCGPPGRPGAPSCALPLTGTAAELPGAWQAGAGRCAASVAAAVAACTLTALPRRPMARLHAEIAGGGAGGAWQEGRNMKHAQHDFDCHAAIPSPPRPAHHQAWRPPPAPPEAPPTASCSYKNGLNAGPRGAPAPPHDHGDGAGELQVLRRRAARGALPQGAPPPAAPHLPPPGDS